MRLIAALLMVAAAAETSASAAEAPLVIHYNERPPQHFSKRGAPQGPAIDKVIGALTAAGISYEMRSTPAKQQLVILKANQQPACMLAWVGLPGRERSGKLSEVIYDQRRLWCTLSVPDETMQRLNAALLK
jgi:hypothetical protein